jgi:hypothetical protein
MRILFLLLFIALDSYVALVFFKQKTRQNAFKSLAALIGFAVVSSAVTHLVIPATKQLTSLAQKALISFSIILLTAFICQLVAILIRRAIDWHRANNSANLHRQPIRFAIERQEQLITLATSFYFAGSLLILGGIWLDLAS